MPCTADSHSDAVTSEDGILNIKTSLTLSVEINQ